MFHNFHSTIPSPLIHPRLTIPYMFVFMQSKMDYFTWETHKKISFSLKIIPENNFPQFSSCYSYSSHSYASNDTIHGCIYLEYWTIFNEKHIKKSVFYGKLFRKIMENYFSQFSICRIPKIYNFNHIWYEIWSSKSKASN